MVQRICSTWPIWNTATSTAAGPQVFESMSVGPLSCLKVTAVWRAVDLHTAHASPRGSASRAFSLPCPAGPWYRCRLALANRPIQPGYCVGSDILCCTLPLLVKLSNLAPSTRIAWSTEGEYPDMQATSPGATASVATNLVDGTPGMRALPATLRSIHAEHQLGRSCISVEGEGRNRAPSVNARENIYQHHDRQGAAVAFCLQLISRRKACANMLLLYIITYMTIKQRWIDRLHTSTLDPVLTRIPPRASGSWDRAFIRDG